MPIKLFIDNDYSETIVHDILNKQNQSVILTPNIDKAALLADSVYKEIERVFDKKYKRKTTERSVIVETPLSHLYFLSADYDQSRICGFRPRSIIVDDFTHIPSDTLKVVIAGYCSVDFNKIDVTFYTDDVTNLKIYDWIV